MNLKYTDNSKQLIKELRKVHGALAEAGAESLNMGAVRMERNYKGRLQRFILRNKYTMGATKVYKANAQRSGGDFRSIDNINACVVVRKQKGGKDHYLKAQEEGKTKIGNPKTKGRVPVPLDTARMGGSSRRPVARPYRLNVAGAQTLQIGGRPFGTSGDGFNARGGAQRWAILYKYTGRSGSGKGNQKKGQTHAVGRYGWDMKKPFIFQGMKKGLGIFALKGGRINMIRTLEARAVKVKARHYFEESLRDVKPQQLEAYFQVAARKRIKK
ncbi:MAG: hypothetical protein CVV44_04075 [Spirochaetae bacterium HGW-Spirochaetae-1]|jgi:hypothetical protein|nr:MAG: hypothetical protein CVV44_04075 [Spirochaetae bacterium HGW-Spirochaetae-1]